MYLRRLLISFPLTACILSSCSKVKSAAKDLEDKLFSEPTYEPVEGEDASTKLHGVPGGGPLDTEALFAAMDIAASEASPEVLALHGFYLSGDDETIPEVNSKTIDFLTANMSQKDSLASSTFQKPSLDKVFSNIKKTNGASLTAPTEQSQSYDPKQDTVRLDEASWSGKQEIVISTLGRIGVKNQGQRGTCAAFTGVSHLEYLIMKKHGGELASVDLSEQRFYMLSKSDLWEAGGGTVDIDGGSAWSSGFEMSFGDEGKYPPSSNNPYNIPVEADCPYVDQGQSNELQIPQLASCARGAVRVSNLTDTFYKSVNNGPWKLYSNAPRSAQEIFDFIKTNDVPVPVASVLTANWEDNDGMITLAKSQQPGFGDHTGGHAYLIVGMRKLDESKFPGEGGMCFIIRNSWGTGWGLGGYSCMTLAWFNHHRDELGFDVALDLELDLDYLKQHATGTIPDLSDTAASKEDAPKLTQGEVPEAAGPSGPISGDGGDTPPPNPAPQTTSDGFTVARLLSQSGRLAQVLFKVEGTSLRLRGVHEGQTGVTQDLVLQLEGSNIYFDDEKRHKTHLLAGDIQNDLVTLCGGKYAKNCHLNFVSNENRLVIGASEAAVRSYEPDPDADYTPLISLANYGIDYAYAEGNFADFRFVIKGETSNPIRLAVKPISGVISYMGREIGNYQKLEFCSGSYKSVCRVLFNKEDRNIGVFFKANKK